MSYHKIILAFIYSLFFTCLYSQNELELTLNWEKSENKKILICTLKNVSETSIKVPILESFGYSPFNRIIITDSIGNIQSPHFTNCGLPIQKLEFLPRETMNWEFDTDIFFYSSTSIVKRERPKGKYLIYWEVNGFRSNVVEYLHE